MNVNQKISSKHAGYKEKVFAQWKEKKVRLWWYTGQCEWYWHISEKIQNLFSRSCPASHYSTIAAKLLWGQRKEEKICFKIPPFFHFICFILSTLEWFSSFRVSVEGWKLIHLGVESFISIRYMFYDDENWEFLYLTNSFNNLTARNEEKMLAHCGLAFKWFQPFQVSSINRAAFTSFVDFFLLILCYSLIDLQFVFILHKFSVFQYSMALNQCNTLILNQ